MGNPFTLPFRKLRERIASQEHNGLVVDRAAFTDLNSLLRFGRPWKKQAEAPPRELLIETTNICTANCVFCAYQYQDKFRDGKGVMSDEVFEKALSGFAEMVGGDTADRTIDFTPLVGEPLVDPKIIDRIRRAKEYGFRVFFYTNGMLLHRIDLGEFLGSGVDQIAISTSPLDRESHEALYRTEKYDDLLRGIHLLLQQRKEGGHEVQISLSFRAHMSLAETLQKPDFQRYVRPYLTEKELDQVEIIVRRFDNWGGMIAPEDLVGEMRLATAPRLKRRPCSWTLVPMVLFDGSVRACGARFTGLETANKDDGLLVGDLGGETLRQIWEGERLRDLRRRFAAKEIPRVCQTCTMYRPM